MQAHPITDSEFSLLPTATVSDQYTGNLKSSQQKEGSLHSVTLAQIVNRPDLLPTPTASDGNTVAKSELDANDPKHRLKVAAQVLAKNQLLPTPAVGHIRNNDEPIEDYLDRRAKAESGEYRGMPGVSLGVAIRMEMLPTPKALDGVKGNLKTSQERLDSGHQIDLPNVANDYSAGISWGKFEAAIRRWEQIFGREAPAPTKPDGKEGAHRLSADFVEWMMGLPEGWVCSPEIGLKRNDQLKALGNGVVPQQAELALRLLITEDIKAILET